MLDLLVEVESGFSLGALVRQVKAGGDRGEGLVDAQLLQHSVVGDALEAHMEPVGHDLVVALYSLNCHRVELQELERVVPNVVAGRKVWLELDSPDDAVQVTGEGIAGPRV